MAGIAKPNIEGIGEEAKYTLIGYNLYKGTKGEGLFDGVRSNNWSTSDVAYWQVAGHYVEVEFHEKVNIWRSGTTGWNTHTGKFKITKWNGTSYDDVTSMYNQTVTPITETQWEKTISGLEKGRYRFEYSTSYRLDSEWYVESFFLNKILLLSNEKTYSLESIDTVYETKMTSNTTPTPFIVSASSMWTAGGSTFPPYKAFNGTNIDSSDCWVSANGQVTGWIQIDFGEKKRVNMLSLTSRNFSDPSAVSGFPKDIIIHGSNDGVNFRQIKSFNNLSVTTYNETITLKLPTSYYRIYRLEVLSNNGNTSFTAIGEILYGFKEDIVINIPSYSEQNFINYGMYPHIKFDVVFSNKNYILSKEDSEIKDNVRSIQINRKPLSIKLS